MKEAIVLVGPKVKIIDSPIPQPGPEQLVIKVVVSGSNPKDWKLAEWMGDEVNAGDDIAGIVHSVGSKVWEFKPGDRVASFHEMRKPGGSFAEYAIGWQHTTFHLPQHVSFEDASTIPLAALTAAIGLHIRLQLPQPWTPAPEATSTPLVIYGGASAVGAFAIKIAVKANIHPIIAVAGRGIPFVETLIDGSKGDSIVDYRSGNDSVVEGLKHALAGKKLFHAFDATAEQESFINIAKVLEPTGKLTTVLPIKDERIPKSVDLTMTMVGSSHDDAKDFAYVYSRYFARGLDEGWFTPHPVEVVPGGLDGVEGALEKLKAGKASAVKYVFRIGETPGVQETN